MTEDPTAIRALNLIYIVTSPLLGEHPECECLTDCLTLWTRISMLGVKKNQQVLKRVEMHEKSL